MTESRANEIFRTKYPEGEIIRRNNSSAGNKFWVTFKPEGKVYYYACATYAQLLERFGFEIVYKHDIKTAEDQVTHYEKKLEDLNNGIIDNPFFNCFGNMSDEEALKEDIKFMTDELNKWKEILRHYKEDCILD